MLNNKMAMQNCIKNNAVVLFKDAKERQWITDGRDMYRLWGLPELTPDQVLVMNGVGGKAVDKILMEERDTPEIFDFTDWKTDDEEMQLPGWTVKTEGTELWLTKVGERVMGISVQSLKPTEDKNDEYVRLYVRTRTDGQPYIAAMDGMELMAIISPVPLTRAESFKTALRDLAYDIQQWGFGV